MSGSIGQIDKNFKVEGAELIELAADEGTVDGCHPNDLGFASMAGRLEPTLCQILKASGE